MNDFYIYRHIRTDKNAPFYVGKGCGNRAYDMTIKRNKYHMSIQGVTDVVTEIIMEGLTEEAAFAKEIEFIKMYKDINLCEANFTEGGTGGDTRSGKKHSEETKQKIAESLRGKKYTNERKKNQSLAKIGVKLSEERVKAMIGRKRGPYNKKNYDKF